LKIFITLTVAGQCILVEQIHTDYQTSMKRLRVAHNNAYRIMHYISRIVNVRPQQAIVSGPFVPCLEAICKQYRIRTVITLYQDRLCLF